MKITRKTIIQQIFINFPERASLIAKELANLGIGCVGCMGAHSESLEEGLYKHGIDDEKIDKLINKLNKIVEN